mmetsp:Transcript_14852/g.40716  ORF Transcript_14852/g.40716 Transcript_14852/m.40716 type:complete len:211 (+) Transcript_14852:899-1531(+)
MPSTTRRCIHCMIISQRSPPRPKKSRPSDSKPSLSMISITSSCTNATCCKAAQYSMLMRRTIWCWNVITSRLIPASRLVNATSVLAALYHSPRTCCRSVAPSQNRECAWLVRKTINTPSTKVKLDHMWPVSVSRTPSNACKVTCTHTANAALGMAHMRPRGITEPRIRQRKPSSSYAGPHTQLARSLHRDCIQHGVRIAGKSARSSILTP